MLVGKTDKKITRAYCILRRRGRPGFVPLGSPCKSEYATWVQSACSFQKGPAVPLESTSALEPRTDGRVQPMTGQSLGAGHTYFCPITALLQQAPFALEVSVGPRESCSKLHFSLKLLANLPSFFLSSHTCQTHTQSTYSCTRSSSSFTGNASG